MKSVDKSMQVQTARLSEGMRLIFDQEAPSSSPASSSRSSSRSSGRSSRSTSRDGHSSRSMKRSHRRRSRSRSSSGSSASSNQSRSRSHPRCHRQSSRHHCRRHRYSPPRHYRARSRSFSPSPDEPRNRRHYGSPVCRRYRERAHSRAYNRSPSPDRHYRRRSRSRSRSTSPDHRRQRGFGCRYRGRFSDSSRRSPRSHRSSRTPERASVHLSQDEKKELLKIAAENAVKIVGAEQLQMPDSVKGASKDATLSPDHSGPAPNKRVRPEPEPRLSPTQVTDEASEDGELSPKMSPKRKPITFSINNTVAKPTTGKPHGMAEVKVTPRVDIVGSKKPYGQWITVKTRVPLSSKH